MIKTIFKVIGALIIVGYLLAAGIMYGFWRPEPVYRGIDIHIDYPNDEAHFLNPADIRSKVIPSKLNPIGKPFSQVNTMEISQLIEQNKLILRADCYHTPDSLLRIDVKQRNPIIRVKSLLSVKDSKGAAVSDFFIDLDGELMPAQLGSAIRLPLATGYIRERHIIPLHDFALYLKNHDFWSDEITQIYVRENGDIELIPRVGSHSILVGNFENIDQKLKHVRTFYKKVLPKKGWNAYRVINAKFDGQIVGEINN